jgi:hypothetical protein
VSVVVSVRADLVRHSRVEVRQIARAARVKPTARWTSEYLEGVAVLLIGGGGGADRADTTVGSDTGMTGMSGRAMKSRTMMDSMATHMRAKDAASASSLQSMLATHRQMTANMVAEMNSEMRSTKMSADACWSALMD